MSFTLQQLADLVQGKIVGDGSLVIEAARILKEARPGDITFVEDEKHAGQLLQSRASAAVVPGDFAANHLPVIQVADPLSAFVTIVRQLHPRVAAPVHGVDQRAGFRFDVGEVRAEHLDQLVPLALAQRADSLIQPRLVDGRHLSDVDHAGSRKPRLTSGESNVPCHCR